VPTVRYAAIVIERKLKGRFYYQSQGNSAHLAAWRSKKQAGWNCDWGRLCDTKNAPQLSPSPCQVQGPEFRCATSVPNKYEEVQAGGGRKCVPEATSAPQVLGSYGAYGLSVCAGAIGLQHACGKLDSIPNALSKDSHAAANRPTRRRRRAMRKRR